MNYALLPPTAHAAVADRVDCEFRSLDVAAHATALAFDAGGHYLAAGYGDGSLLVWDLCLRGGAALPPRGAARARRSAVAAVAWAADDASALLSMDVDGVVVAWDFCAAGALAEAARLDLGAGGAGGAAGLSCAAGVALACARGAPPALLRRAGKTLARAAAYPGPAAAACLLPRAAPVAVAAADGTARCAAFGGGAAALGPALALGGGAATGLSAAPGGKLVALTSDDGAVRLLGVGGGALPALELRHALRDHVDRLSWRACAFGAAGERVVAGASSRGAVELYVWEAASGALLARVADEDGDAADGDLAALACHPRGAIVATAAGANPPVVKLWASDDSRSWRAFAPGFEELHENTRHEEREDEFDTVLDAPDAAAPPPPPRPSSPVEILAPRPGMTRPELGDAAVRRAAAPPPPAPPEPKRCKVTVEL